MNDKRILVLSMSAWNSKVGSDTWATLMGQYKPENVANICLREEKPDSSAAGSYFVISENRIIKSVLKRKTKTGYVVNTDATDDSHSEDLKEHNERYKKMSKKRSYSRLLAREMIWWLGKWKTKELCDFVDNFKPDIVLFFMDGYIHFNRLCRFVIKRTGAKAIGFFVDDNFTYKQSKGLGFKAYRFLQRRSLKKLAKKTDSFWAITDMTKEEADKTFKINSTVVTKPLRSLPTYTPKACSSPVKILYTGNLQIGRDRSLLKVVKALEEINKDKIKFEIDVYTKTVLSEEMASALNCGYCHIHDPIPQAEVFKLQAEADVLLFLEDVDGKDARTARLSFSTKITDYLSASKCILAIGCLETAPMRYFVDNGSAIVAQSEDEIRQRLLEIEKDNALLEKYAKAACQCGIKNHNKEEILNLVDKTIEEVLNGD